MSVNRQEMLDFHLTGRRRNAAVAEPVPDAFPALLAPYRDLEALRYDFPLILRQDAESEAFVDSLTPVINRLVKEIAPEGGAGTQLRQHVLRLETRMRRLAGDTPDMSLTGLWQEAERSLLQECGENEAEIFGNNIATARFALRVDGELAACDERVPSRLFQHAWRRLEVRRTRVTREKIETLLIRLRNILKVDELKEDSAHAPQKLRATFGKRYRETFDFERMSEILDGATLRNRLPAERRRRIGDAVSILEEQKFFALFGAGEGRDHHGFLFDSLSAAIKAYDARLEEMADVVKALEIAELEVENGFREDRHSSYFDNYGAQSLSTEDFAMFPSYLVCVDETEWDTRETASLMEVVSRELPMKILLQVGDALGNPSPIDGSPHQGSYVQQLEHTFLAGNAFVLQSAASDLYRQSEQIRRGLEFGGPSIFSVFVPRDDAATTLPPYLVAAAAAESRVFPAFTYDPSAGAGLAERFDVAGNPDADDDWPRRELRYEDEALQAVVEDYRFTLADFAVADRRYAGHFATVAKEDWNDDMLPLAAYLELSSAESVDKVPYVAVVDSDNRLRRMVVDDNLVRMVRRCRNRWRSLQELGGIHNSYAAAARSAAAAESVKEANDQEAVAPVAEADSEDLVAESTAAAADTEAVGDAEAGDAAVADEPWIETPRCTTCDECTTRNPRMFAYDDNRQAYIADPDAGTFRELVEAAENCQVAIIHPGKPRNPDEPGLSELIQRAEPFNTPA